MDELLLAEEIEEKLFNIQTRMADIKYHREFLIRSPAISDKDCRRKVRALDNTLKPLEAELKAYETAINYAGL